MLEAERMCSHTFNNPRLETLARRLRSQSDPGSGDCE